MIIDGERSSKIVWLLLERERIRSDGEVKNVKGVRFIF